MLGLLFRSRFNGFSIVQRTAYSARAQDGPKDMERNQAGARQHDWLLLSFVPFPVGHPEHEHWGLLYKMFCLNGLSVYYRETE